MKLRLLLGSILVGLLLTQSSHAALESGNRIYIDFGKNDWGLFPGNNGIIMPSDAPMNTEAGNSTGIPDSYENHWNNAWMNSIAAGGTTPPTVVNLVTSTNQQTGVDLSFSNGWESNGINNGGLANPSFSLLGDFASPNATMDATGSMERLCRGRWESPR